MYTTAICLSTHRHSTAIPYTCNMIIHASGTYLITSLFIYDHNEYANDVICIYANQNAIFHKLSNKETTSKETKGKSNESI